MYVGIKFTWNYSANSYDKGAVDCNEETMKRLATDALVTYHLTTCKSTFQFSLGVSLSTNPSASVFHFFISQIMSLQLFFLQLLFPQHLLILLPFTSSPPNY